MSDICADCKTRNPRWASHNIGIFICMNCASIHRKIGTHITKVKSLTMDTWTKEQVETMKTMGNVKSNSIYNPNEIRHPPPANLVDSERDSELESYIRSKYEFKRFMDKSAIVASKLGPSRSASSFTPSSRSVSSPLTSATSTPSSTSRTSSALPSTQTLTQVPKRPYTSADTTAPIPRAVSQPVSIPQQSHAPPEPKESDNVSGGVWADLISLQTPSSSSSLPLQYQANPPQASFGGGAATTLQTGMGVGVNPFQQQKIMSNPFSQHMAASPLPFTPSGMTPAYASSQQLYFPSQPQVQPPASAQMQMQPQFFQPRPQQGHLQIQPQGSQPAFASPVTPGAYASAPASQGQFPSSSPAIPSYSSHSPQMPLPMLSGTPQLQMPMQQPAQFISHSPHSIMMGTPLPITSQSPAQIQMPQGSFMSTTPQTGQFTGFQGQAQGQMFMPGGVTGHQWGAM